MFSRFSHFVTPLTRQMARRILFCLGFAILGCAPKIGEDPPKQNDKELTATACLRPSIENLHQFFKGDASEGAVRSSFTCMDVVLDRFLKFVRGKAHDRYSTQEVASFIEQNFLQSDPQTAGKKISQELQTQVMKFKRIFIGGELDVITFEEVNQLRSVLSQLGRMAVRLNSSMKILTFHWEPKLTESIAEEKIVFEKSNEAIQDFIVSLADLVLQTDPTYNLSDLGTFFQEIQNFYGSQWNFVKDLETFLPTAKKLKKSLAGGDEDTVKSGEWRSFLLLGGRGYVQYLRYHYFIKEQVGIETGHKIASVVRTAEDTFSIFQALVQAKPTGILAHNDLNEVLKTFSKAWPTFQFSDKLSSEVMKLKKLIVGGTETDWSVLDFELAQRKLSLIQGLVERFLPYYDVYGLEWDSKKLAEKDAHDFFRSSKAGLQTIGNEIVPLFEGSYDLNSIIALLKEIERLYPPSDTQTSLAKTFSDGVPLFTFLRGKILNDSTLFVQKSQWQELIIFASDFYSDYLYYRYFLKALDFLETAVPQRILVFAQDLNESMLRILRKIPTHEITKSDLVEIIDRVQGLGYLKGLQDKTTLNLLEVVLNGVLLSPEERLAKGFRRDIFDKDRLAYAMGELRVWLDVENFFRQLVDKTELISPQSLNERIVKRLESKELSAEERLGLTETQKALSTPFPLVTDTEGRVIVNPTGQVLNYHRPSLMKVNLVRTTARVFM